MARLPYPALALDNITRAIDIVRAGQVVEKRDLFANLAWNLQGPLQALVFGNPDAPPTAAAIDEDADLAADLDERLDEFAWVLDCARSQYNAVAAANDVAADAKSIDPATILAIVNIVLQLIDAWRKRRN
ncbi:MAG: hypothetical protein IT426_12030 [Pirellulales bacterium]|nr:hypothetical protein [Pirellulales bacterium]